MKVSEIFFSDREQREIFESLNKVLSYHLIDTETFNEIRAKQYEIDIDPIIKVIVQTMPFEDRMIGEVSFFSDNGYFKLLNAFSATRALSIIATIIDICEQEKDITVWTFTSKPGNGVSPEEAARKAKFYERVALKYAKDHSLFMVKFEKDAGHFFVLSKEKIEKDQIIRYIEIW